MKFYVIKDFNSGKYYDFRSHYVEDLNNHTEFFDSKEAARKKIHGDEDEALPYHMSISLDVELAWKYLERKYKKPAWLLEVDHDELALTRAMFRLSPVEIEVNPLDY